MLKEIELICITADSKIWSNKLEALSKISDFLMKLSEKTMFTYSHFEKIMDLVCELMTDIHFKVSSRANEIAIEMIDCFSSLMSNSILEKVVLTALNTAFDSRKEEVS